MLDERKVEEKILALETMCVSPLECEILVYNIRIRRDSVLAGIVILHNGISLTDNNRVYPRDLFNDCQSDSNDDANNMAILIEYERVVRKLASYKLNEEGYVLADVDNLLSKCRVYYSWWISPESTVYAEPGYYAGKLVSAINEANQYIEKLKNGDI